MHGLLYCIVWWWWVRWSIMIYVDMIMLGLWDDAYIYVCIYLFKVKTQEPLKNLTKRWSWWSSYHYKSTNSHLTIMHYFKILLNFLELYVSHTFMYGNFVLVHNSTYNPPTVLNFDGTNANMLKWLGSTRLHFRSTI